MLNCMMLISLFVFYSGLFSFVFNYFHLLNSLLSLEFVSLSIFLIMIYVFSGLSEEIFSLYFLIMLVCESVLGLSLLIVSVYSYSYDYMKNMNLLVC
uniref:NADH-ubiquinone oxidoreductase chain 4L n=1 Tax=Pseudoniphargus gorbeanus TaxID=1688789 RepID=A0A0M6X7M4_9CRUS|nr:NADH dehydrogenase subunit 4L [Pseudoniphargus gorbeanus]